VKEKFVDGDLPESTKFVTAVRILSTLSTEGIFLTNATLVQTLKTLGLPEKDIKSLIDIFGQNGKRDGR